MRLNWAFMPVFLFSGSLACTFDVSGVSFGPGSSSVDQKVNRDARSDRPKPGKDMNKDRPTKPPGDSKPPLPDQFIPPDTKRPPDTRPPDRFLVPDTVKCPPPLIKCGPACVNISQDNQHCAGCFKPCPTGFLCSKKKCCPFLSTNCGGACVFTAKNDKHCSGCNKPCPATHTCTNGHCCLKGERYCGSKCVDLKIDTKHCGFCGNKCPTGQVCKNGACCLPGQVNCNGSCADLQWDPQHCGVCKNACKPSEACSGALCCPIGETNCSGTCYNLGANLKNCGKCENNCKTGEKCNNGVCGTGSTTTSGCAAGTDDQTFNGGMRGCKGQVSFAKRADLCSGKFRVCGAKEWVNLRGNTNPTYNYWTDDVLYAYSTWWGCGVTPSQYYGVHCSATVPMRVCAGASDPLGNKCQWTGCGYQNSKKNHRFGGCNGNLTAGSLCCPK